MPNDLRLPARQPRTVRPIYFVVVLITTCLLSAGFTSHRMNAQSPASSRSLPITHPGCTGTDMWVGLGEGVPDWPLAVATMNGDLYVLRKPNIPGNDFSPGTLLKWNGEYWHEEFSYDRPDSFRVQIVSFQNEIYVNSFLGNLDGIPGTVGIYRWDGKQIRGVGTHRILVVDRMAATSDALYALAVIDMDGNMMMMKWDGLNWTELFPLDGFNIFDMTTSHDTLFIGGAFENFGGVAGAKYLVAIVNGKIVKLDNLPESAVYRLRPYNGGLYLASMRGPDRDYYAYFWKSGTPITPMPNLPTGGDASNSSFVEYKGELYSSVSTFGFMPSFIWRYNGTEWLPVSSASGAQEGIYNLIADADNLYMYGSFTESCGLPMRNVARLCNEDVCGRVTGVVYHDMNQDCVRDNGEDGIGNQIISFEPGPYYASTDEQGVYNAFLPVGSYTTSFSPKRHWIITCADGQSVSVATSGSTLENVDFGTDAVDGMSDVSVSLSSSTARPGRRLFYTLRFDNVGTETVSGTVSLAYDDQLEFVGSTEEPLRENGSLLEWDIVDMTSGTSASMTLEFMVPETAQMNDQLCTTAEFGIGGVGLDDAVPGDNRDELCQLIRSSFDPNSIEVAPMNFDAEQNPQPLGAGDTLLTYMVRFQNTGNDTAFRVVVRDTLNPELFDPATVQLGSASHPYMFSMTGQGALTFEFNDIMLPDSNVNEGGSHGYFTFSVRLRNGLSRGTHLPNDASIYFDYNGPVKTNRVVSITSSVAVDRTIHQSLTIYPNPSRGTSLISLRLDHASNVELRLIDTKGSVVCDLLSSRLDMGEHRVELKTGNLPAGLYFVTVIRDGEKEVYPVVVAE